MFPCFILTFHVTKDVQECTHAEIYNDILNQLLVNKDLKDNLEQKIIRTNSLTQ